MDWFLRNWFSDDLFWEIYARSFKTVPDSYLRKLKRSAWVAESVPEGMQFGRFMLVYILTHAKCVERHRNTHEPPKVSRRGDNSGG